MKILFNGVRGSVPAPGPETVKYGGNTTSLKVTSQSDITLLIDAGTGIRKLNYENLDEPVIKLIFTHCHWDHLQGLPFFKALYYRSKKIEIFIYRPFFDGIKDAVIKQMSGKSFPVTFDQIPCQVEFIPIDDVYSFSETFKLFTFNNHHPGDSTALKIVEKDKAFSFITDNEIAGLKKNGRYEDFLKFCSSSTILAHDSQYTEADMPAKSGYGHSTVDDVVQLFCDINPEVGILTHHDPERSDEEVDEIKEYAEKSLRQKSVKLN